MACFLASLRSIIVLTLHFVVVLTFLRLFWPHRFDIIFVKKQQHNHLSAADLEVDD